MSALLALTLSPIATADSRSPPPRCTPAAIADISLPFPVAVDEIRVVVATNSPVAGAATVRIDSGRFDRVLRVFGATSKRLSFTPALASRVFQISLDPVFEAPLAACIERVELVRAGVTIAVVEP